MLPAILGAVARVGAAGAGRNAAGQFVAAGIGGKLKKAGMGALKRSIRNVPGHLARASGASSNPLFNKVVDAAGSAYSTVQEARRDQARRQERNAADRARRERRREEGSNGKEEMAAKAAETESRRETAETENAIRQEKAHQQGTIEIAKESNHAMTAMANDIAIIRERIEGQGGEKQEEGSFLGNLTKVLLGVFVGGIGLLQAKLTSIIGEWGGKLGLKTLGNAASRVGGMARTAQEMLSGPNNVVARLGAAITSGPGAHVRAGIAGAQAAGGPFGLLSSAITNISGPAINAAGRATGAPAAALGKLADGAGRVSRLGDAGVKHIEQNGNPLDPFKLLGGAIPSASAATPTISAGQPAKTIAAASASTLTSSSASSPTASMVRSMGSSATSTAGMVQIMAEMLDQMTSSSKGIYTRASDEMMFGMNTPGSYNNFQPSYAAPTSSISPGGSMSNASAPRRKAGPFSGFGAEVDGHISEAANMYGIPEDVLRGFVKMEGGWTGAMSPTGAIGTGQFTKGTWDSLAKTSEGRAIGMREIGKDFRTANDPRHDKRVNTLATGLLAKQNADLLRRAGLEVTGENLYMVHNIGPGVIPALKGQPVSAATQQAMRLNGMTAGMSSNDFVAFQKDRFQSHYASANSITTSKPNMAEIVQEASAARRAPNVPIMVPPPTPTTGNGKSPPQGGQAQSGAQTPMVTRNPDSPVRGYSQRLIGQSITA